MTTGIACCVAVLCAAGFITIWFSTVYRELSEKRESLDGLWEQLQLHQSASAQARDGTEQEVARKMLATNRSIFLDALESYNALLRKSVNYIPALLLGFHPMSEEKFRAERQAKTR